MALPPGDYVLEVSKDGFKPITQNVTLQVAQVANVNFVMEPGDGYGTDRSEGRRGIDRQPPAPISAPPSKPGRSRICPSTVETLPNSPLSSPASTGVLRENAGDRSGQ